MFTAYLWMCHKIDTAARDTHLEPTGDTAHIFPTDGPRAPAVRPSKGPPRAVVPEPMPGGVCSPRPDRPGRFSYDVVTVETPACSLDRAARQTCAWPAHRQGHVRRGRRLSADGRPGGVRPPMVAPLVALLVVQLTLYKTVVHGIGKVVAVLAGVLVAVLVANFAGVTWWSLGAVVAGSLLVGKLLRLGPHLFEAPITAMLLLEVGATGGLGASRVGEAIVGAVVGIAVSVLVAPPLYMQPAGDAIGELARRMADFSRGFADGLR